MEERNKKKVLVAEKNEVVRETLTDYLDAIGCEVSVCSDRQSLLKLVADTTYNAVLLGDDIDRSEGSSLVAEILEVNAAAAVVVLVAYRSVDQVLNVYRQGAVDVVIRPHQYQELGLTLERAFRRNRQNMIHSFFNEHRDEISKIAGGDKLDWEVQPLESRV